MIRLIKNLKLINRSTFNNKLKKIVTIKFYYINLILLFIKTQYTIRKVYKSTSN